MALSSRADCVPWAIRDKPTAPASAWQNGFAERLIGSIRRECLDHVIVLGEAHLHRILKNYAAYYNGVRTHRSLHKDAPVSRPVQRSGAIISHAILGGLHHQYVRIKFSVHTPLILVTFHTSLMTGCLQGFDNCVNEQGRQSCF